MQNLKNHFFKQHNFSCIPGIIFRLGMFVICFYTCCVYILVDCSIELPPLLLFHIYFPAIEYITISCVWLVFGALLLDRLFRRI